MPSLINAAREIIDAIGTRHVSNRVAAALLALREAIDAEPITAAPVVKATPGKKRGPIRRLDYAAIRDAVAANDRLPPEKRRTRDEIAAEFNTSAVTVRKAMRTGNQEQ